VGKADATAAMKEVRRRRRNDGVVVARVQEEHAIVFLLAAGLLMYSGLDVIDLAVVVSRG
jgi:hypothetical protein